LKTINTPFKIKKPPGSQLQLTLAFLSGPILATIVGVICFNANIEGMTDKAAWTAVITTICAVWWILEPIPIPVVSLIPFVLFPIFGILSHKTAAAQLGNHLIILFMGGFMLSVAMEKSKAHRRVAYGVLKIVGTNSRKKILFGFMLATAFLSMWISNTATTLMMMPIAMAVLAQDKDETMTVPLLLGICYAASIGGVATLIGTPPNGIFIENYQVLTGIEMSFTEWMSIGGIMSLVMLPLAWIWLGRRISSVGAKKIHLPEIGEWTKAQKRVLFILAITAFLWITRAIPLGTWQIGENAVFIKGWGGLMEHYLGIGTIGDSTIALLAVLALFIIPEGEKYEDGQHHGLLDWQHASQIPWGILLLFAGGIVIAKGFLESGLSQVLGNQLILLADLPLWLIIGIICLTVTFLTEVTSNTATANVLLPILGAATLSMNLENPLLLMVPATISASFAFMLPVATPPNAIVMSSGKIPIRVMAREGLFLNLMGAFVVTLVCYFML
jgi:sodium-dependent dicarboxylate transporter 2/3/5